MDNNSTQPVFSIMSTTDNNSTGTAPTGQGPGTGTALEAQLTAYLAQQLAAATATNGSYGDIPLPQASTPQVTVIQAPAESGGKLPMIVAGVATVVGLASGVAYLVDRHKRGGKK